MKKSAEILGLPIISITEGRELGTSKTLLIDAKNGKIAAITIEDADWYRGVKLIPYESVIAIGADAVTITSSENILKLDEAGDYEQMLDDNIRVIGTKAITKGGTIEGAVSEIYVGDDGKIEKVEITQPSGQTSEVSSDQISIFGKQVTVIDAQQDAAKPADTPAAPEEKAAPEKKAEPEAPAAKPAEAKKDEPAKEKAAEAPKSKPAKEEKSSPKQDAAEKANEERRRRFLLGKKATRTIKMDNGIVIVEAGQDITEEVLQKAKLANKFIELSMNVQ
jgi:uncharacterized protein YrrD